MAKKPHKKENENSVDAEMLRQFMLGGTDFKDSERVKKSSASIDLHLDEASGVKNSSAGEKLNAQLAHLEKQIDNALVCGCSNTEVVHGIGSGKLKEAVHAFLKKHPRVKSFRLKHQGATEVFFK